MAKKGSQLVQLRSALAEAGVSRQSKPSSKKRKRFTGGAVSQERDKDKAAKKLREIYERLNQFDVKVTKLKHDVGGRKLKGISGRPSQSKQVGIEQRKKTLLVEYEKRNHAGGIIDRRFGENDPTMTPEERMLERFTRERQRTSKGVAFNLEDEDDLTHYGQSLSAMDDFDDVGLGSEDHEETSGQIDGKIVGKTHFGGFKDEGTDEEGPIRKKSKAEVMAEVIAKSKEHKYLRQMEKDENENARFQLDQEFDSIRGLLVEDMSTGSNAVPLGSSHSAGDIQTAEHDDQAYDQFVRELAFDKRAKPKDRTKTEDELALEEKEALEKAERARLRRMMGIDVESDDNGVPRGGRKRKKGRGGDDLEDDFVDEDEPDGLGRGLDGESKLIHQDGENEGEGEVDERSESSEFEGDTSFDYHNGSELEEDEGGDFQPLVDSPPRTRNGSTKRHTKERELPFTFPCPASYDEFLSILEDVEDESVPTVVQRIRSLHHPSLSKDNSAKLQAFTGVLVDYILHITSPPTPRFSLLNGLIPHLYALTQAYPAVSAQVFVEKLSLMHKNLVRGLSRGATSPKAKTWPGPTELGILRVIGTVWSTSDLNHAVVSPARMLMGAYLGLGRIRSIVDLASGLFLCTLFLQFEELSKRLVPEAINFLMNTVLHLAPHRFEEPELVPGSFPIPDFGSDISLPLKIRDNVEGLQVSHPNLVSILCEQDHHTLQSRVSLLGTAFQLLSKFAEMYKGLDGFVELYQPVADLLQNLMIGQMPRDLRERKTGLLDMILRLLKFSGQSRRPLFLQAHKPIPIPSYVPKFSTTSSNYLRKQDPDHERAAASKLRSQVKQERKGAIRELRKDSKFLAGVQQARQAELDKKYNDRMKKAFSSIEGERAEQKAMEREKVREKKRAGRK